MTLRKKIVLLAGVALSACAGRSEEPQTERVFKSEVALAGRDRRLFEITIDAGPTLVRTLDETLQIAGMALDVDGDLVLLDGSAKRLLELQRP